MKFNNNKRISLIFGIFLLITASLLFIFPAYKLTIPKYHTHDLLSFDNVYVNGKPTGPDLSKSAFWYGVVEEKDNVLIVKQSFDVRTLSNKPIFSISRLYGIDPKTGMHVPGYGDKDREGYLFAPKNFRKQPFVYWHINYDTPANMNFESEEKIEGLTVYKYKSVFTADQTKELERLEGVPEKYGISLDVTLILWIEPETGSLISYEDHATAYYYDIETKERLSKWNEFSNRMTIPMIQKHVTTVRYEKNRVLLNYIIPAGLSALGILLLAIFFMKRKKR